MIIVTGASRGLGEAVSLRLLEKGYNVFGLARNVEKMAVPGMACDVTSYQSLKNIARQLKKSEAVEAVINAAGVASMNLAVTTDEATVQKLIQTNLVGTIYSCQLFAPLMLRHKSGVIVNFSSIAVSIGLKGEAVYAASKAGVEAFSRAFAREVAAFNIRVNCIAPGPIKTDLLRGVSESQIKDVVSHQIINRNFEKSDICDLVELLLDEKAASLSGQVMHVGGV